jgi:hypothetical protein
MLAWPALAKRSSIHAFLLSIGFSFVSLAENLLKKTAPTNLTHYPL